MAGPKTHKSLRNRRNAAQPFNMMVTGHSFTGKSSFVRTLVESLEGKRFIHDPTAAGGSTGSLTSPTSPDAPKSPHVPTEGAGSNGLPLFPLNDITVPTPTSSRIEFEEPITGERLSLRLIDTPGLPIPVNIHKQLLNPSLLAAADAEYRATAKNWTDMIVHYIDAQYEATLVEESKVRRNPKSPDFQTHLCLYFLDPQTCLATKGLTPIDRYALKVLTSKVNVIPCLSKADLLTTKQLTTLRTMIIDDLQANDIPIFAFPEDPEVEYEPETLKLNADLRALLPFAIINDEELDPLSPTDELANLSISATNPMRKQGGPLGRRYPWGMVEVENPEHCDFIELVHAIFASHLEDLKVLTRELYYEQWRTDKLLEVRNAVLPKTQMQSPPAGARMANGA
ncbi:hypothetical protein HDV05_008333 [Chytridiales sp. JEL 0842]|nr:hypothetical protein HDV05_008333 [Chytridiales sp. JEL 0842]